MQAGRAGSGQAPPGVTRQRSRRRSGAGTRGGPGRRSASSLTRSANYFCKQATFTHLGSLFTPPGSGQKSFVSTMLSRGQTRYSITLTEQTDTPVQDTPLTTCTAKAVDTAVAFLAATYHFDAPEARRRLCEEGILLATRTRPPRGTWSKNPPRPPQASLTPMPVRINNAAQPNWLSRMVQVLSGGSRRWRVFERRPAAATPLCSRRQVILENFLRPCSPKRLS